MEGVNFNSASILEKDKSVTYNKLDDNLRYDIDSNRFVDNVQFQSTPLISKYEIRISSQQGMCVIDNRYVVVCNYVNKDDEGTTIEGGRMLSVYDVVDKVEKSHQIFTETQLGHANSLCYYDGYLYVAMLNRKVAKLSFDPNTFKFTVVSTITLSVVLSAIAVHDGKFIGCNKNETSTVDFYESDDCITFSKLCRLDADGSYQSIQGLDFDGKYIYYSTSTYIPPGTQSVSSNMNLFTELIYVLSLEGKVYRCFSYSRGSYGEIEDVSTITLQGKTALLVSTNATTEHIGNIEVSPIFNDCNVSEIFDTVSVTTTRTDQQSPFELYVDGSVISYFSRGTSTKPFTSIYLALQCVRRFGNNRVKLNISNIDEYGILVLGISNHVDFYFNTGCKFRYYFSIRQCNNVVIDGTNSSACTIDGYFAIENSSVSIRSGLKIVKGQYTTYIANYRGFLSGYLGAFQGESSNSIRMYQAITNLNIGSNYVIPQDTVNNCTGSLCCINNTIVGCQFMN